MKLLEYQIQGATLTLRAKYHRMILTPWSDGIIRCVTTTKEEINPFSPLEIPTPKAQKGAWTAKEEDDRILFTLENTLLEVDKNTTKFTWKDATTEREILKEDGKELTPIPVMKHTTDGEEPIITKVQTIDGRRNFIENLREYQDREAYKAKLRFRWQDGESIHGLGQAEEGIYNYRNNIQYLFQNNMRIPMPALVSSQGYGILFDCGSLMTFNDDPRGSFVFLDTVEQLDYYFVVGDTLDDIIAGFRKLTGKATLLPKWSYGYVQSKEHYRTQDELVDVVKEYRERGVPLDCIVQDWNTWEPKMWGNKRVDKERYPNLKQAMDEIHDMNVHTMVSVWPNTSEGSEDYEEFSNSGYLLNDATTYNPFLPEAREMFWKQAETELFSGGFDSWWCDSTEPFCGPDWRGVYQKEPWQRYYEVGNEHKKFLDPAEANLFALVHAKGIYENQRKATDSKKRVLNLTRSGYAGSQKYGAVLWSGDITATWKTMRQQIAEGLNMSMSGMPWWTLDIGGFFTVKDKWENRGCGAAGTDNVLWFWNGDFNDGNKDLGYRELYTRWLQYGAFLPMFRSHGTDTAREIWRFGEKGEPFYDTIETFIKLRYRLMPYIYSVAAKVTHEDYTMMRSLLFDFPQDEKSKEIDDQFLCGPSLLICPVTEPMYYLPNSVALPEDTKKEWDCYLPEGTKWYDYWTDTVYEGGRTITANAPLELMPLYVKAGAILPMEQGMQYATDSVDTPFEIHIYEGADGAFMLYEDHGDNYDYEQGDFNAIPLAWNNENKEFSIGTAEHQYPASILNRDVIVTLHSAKGKTQQSFAYTGAAHTLSF